MLSLPIIGASLAGFALRFLLATRPEVVTQALGIVYRAISGHLIRKAGLTRASATELQSLVQVIAERIGRGLERSGLITRDIENSYLAFDPAEEAPIHGLLGYSITYRIATGPRAAQGDREP